MKLLLSFILLLLAASVSLTNAQNVYEGSEKFEPQNTLTFSQENKELPADFFNTPPVYQDNRNMHINATNQVYSQEITNVAFPVEEETDCGTCNGCDLLFAYFKVNETYEIPVYMDVTGMMTPSGEPLCPGCANIEPREEAPKKMPEFGIESGLLAIAFALCLKK